MHLVMEIRTWGNGGSGSWRKTSLRFSNSAPGVDECTVKESLTPTGQKAKWDPDAA